MCLPLLAYFIFTLPNLQYIDIKPPSVDYSDTNELTTALSSCLYLYHPFLGMSAMLEVSSSLSQSMACFCSGELSTELLVSLGAQPLDHILASASRLPPPPCLLPKGFNGECSRPVCHNYYSRLIAII